MALEQYFRNAEEENCSLQQCLTVLLRNICLNPFFFFFETGFLLLPFLVSRRDLGWKSQGWFIHIKKHLLRGTRLSCLLQGQSIISRCLLVCQKSSIEQFHSIKKYLKEWFSSTFLYIIDSAPKAKKNQQTNHYSTNETTSECNAKKPYEGRTTKIGISSEGGYSCCYLGQQKESKTWAWVCNIP